MLISFIKLDHALYSINYSINKLPSPAPPCIFSSLAEIVRLSDTNFNSFSKLIVYLFENVNKFNILGYKWKLVKLLILPNVSLR